MLRWTAVGPWGQFDVHAVQAVGLKAADNVRLKRIKKLASLHPEETATIGTPQAETPEQQKTKKREWKNKVKEHMTRAFQANAEQLDALLPAGDTTGFWLLWCSCVEDAYINARQLTEKEAKAILNPVREARLLLCGLNK